MSLSKHEGRGSGAGFRAAVHEGRVPIVKV